MMCEARDAIHARKQAAECLTRACIDRVGIIAAAFVGVLAEPMPDALRRLTEEAERRLGR